MSISKKFILSNLNEVGALAVGAAAVPLLSMLALKAGIKYSERTQPKFEQIGEKGCGNLPDKSQVKKCRIYFLNKNRRNDTKLNSLYAEQEKIEKQMKKSLLNPDEVRRLNSHWKKCEDSINKYRDHYFNELQKIKAS